MNSESYFISKFTSKHIGDDGAVINGYIYSKDAFFENIHFKNGWLSYYQVAKKAMYVNISDAIAMGAEPLYALLSVAMPNSVTKKQIKELYDGFADAASEFGIEIIGGDTISNTKLDITVTIISKTKKPLLRKGIRDGYLLAYTGKLGQSKKELKKLFNLGAIHKKSKFVKIQLRDTFIKKARRYIKAGMDISDGLYSDVGKMASLNKTGFKFFTKISKDVGCSGEEYEMLIAFDKRDKKALLRYAKLSKTKLSIFAYSARCKYTNRCKAHHF